MSIYKFTDSFDNNKTYSYKILVYPNITFQKDLEKDSYVVVLGNIIRELNKIRDDIHWTIFSPGGNIQSLSFENTLQLPIKFPPYPNAMRLHFNQIDIIKQIDFRKNDFDIVYSHLPEHTLQLKNVFLNETNIEPKFIGYTHWTEFPEITNYAATVMDINFLGLLAMEKCGVNTQGQKNLILKNAKTHFNDDVVKRLDTILEPQYLGWEIPKYEKQTTNKKIIVYNHRPHTYKNYPWFLEQMDKLWEKRKDFEVWVPLADSKEREYMTIDKYDRKGYFSKLSSCYLGVCAKQKYSGWAVSATDGMSVGVPYLFSDNDYYHELADSAGCYYADGDDLILKIENLFDVPDLRNEWSDKSLKRFEQGKWENQIYQFNNMINDTIENLPMLKSDTDTYKKVVDFIHRKKSVTKGEILKMLNWGVRISFSGYRNRLRNEPTIRFTKDRYEVIE
jgi:glycosyltransferase involved in cell wall biosynthesis